MSISKNVEEEELKLWADSNDKYNYLYPNINDKAFNRKIAEKQEFSDTKYKGELVDINEESKESYKKAAKALDNIFDIRTLL